MSISSVEMEVETVLYQMNGVCWYVCERDHGCEKCPLRLPVTIPLGGNGGCSDCFKKVLDARYYNLKEITK